MTRIKRGVLRTKKRRSLKKLTKGFRWGRKNLRKRMKEAVLKSLSHSYRHRRTKKREMRSLWQVRINAACRQHGLTYSHFIHQLKNNQVKIDRKILAALAADYPDVFAALIDEVSASQTKDQKVLAKAEPAKDQRDQ